MDVLSYLVGERSHQLPSFVPDWAHQPDFKEYRLRVNFLDAFSAATDTIATVKEVATRKLAVRGILVDTILENPFPDETWEEKFKKCQLLFYKGNSPKVIYRHTGEPREIAWWITVCGGMNLHPDRDEVTFSRMMCLKDLDKFREFESRLKTPTLDRNHLAPKAYYVKQIFPNATYGRSLIFTERGYIVGFGPEPISSMDRLMIFSLDIVHLRHILW